MTTTAGSTRRRRSTGATAPQDPPLSLKGLKEICEAQGVSIGDLEARLAELESGKRTTLRSACYAAGLDEEALQRILALKSDAELTDIDFLVQMVHQMGEIYDIAAGASTVAAEAKGLAETSKETANAANTRANEAVNTANEAKVIAADAYTAAAPSKFNWIAAGITAFVWFFVCIFWVLSDWKVPIYSTNGKLVGEGVGFADSNWAFLLVVLTGVLLVAAFGWLFATKQQHESAPDPDNKN